jgi:hypothetical protein
MFCGYKSRAGEMTVEQRKAKEDADFKQKCRDNELEYLRTTRQKLITFRMQSTGCVSLDDLIIREIGDWRQEL